MSFIRTVSPATRSRAGWWLTGELVEMDEDGVTTIPVIVLVADQPGPQLWTRLIKALERARLGVRS